MAEMVLFSSGGVTITRFTQFVPDDPGYSFIGYKSIVSVTWDGPTFITHILTASDGGLQAAGIFLQLFRPPAIIVLLLTHRRKIQ
jgi:hypothetical protein